MHKYLLGITALILLCGAVFMIAGCGESMASAGKKEYIVGKDIALSDIKDFYYTIDASTNPPHFQRYRFSNKSGKYTFYHEKREGNVWPLDEKHITVSGTKELSEQEWRKFFSYIENGRVTKRIEDANAGGRGPWLYLYWNKDKNVYQVFNFAKLEQRRRLEKYFLELQASP